MTQSSSEYVLNEMDTTPTHKTNDVMEILKAGHEKEMSELRKYLENDCQEL